MTRAQAEKLIAQLTPAEKLKLMEMLNSMEREAKHNPPAGAAAICAMRGELAAIAGQKERPGRC